MKVWNTEDTEDEVLAMVVRVKLDTTMGSMLRQLIAPVAAMQAKISFETVSGLDHLEYALACCECQGALFSAMQAKVSFETVSGLYHLEYALACCKCQAALFSAMQAKVSFEMVSCLYHLEYALTCCDCQRALFGVRLSVTLVSSLALFSAHASQDFL